MNPDAALDMQLSKYRQMTGEQRLKLALDLHEFACNVAREGIRHQFPNADETEVERQLARRISLTREYERTGKGYFPEILLEGTIKPKIT